MTKICSKCGIEKSLSDYFKDKQKSSGIRPDCKKCNTTKSLNWSKNNKSKRKSIQLKYHYNLSNKEYTDLLVSQNYCCAICLKLESSFKRKLHVDHDHNTGAVRGLLCQYCNWALGHFKDNLENLYRAISYLEKPKCVG